MNAALVAPVVVESDQLDGLGVHHHHLIGFDLVRKAEDLGQDLVQKSRSNFLYFGGSVMLMSSKNYVTKFSVICDPSIMPSALSLMPKFILKYVY